MSNPAVFKVNLVLVFVQLSSGEGNPLINQLSSYLSFDLSRKNKNRVGT